MGPGCLHQNPEDCFGSSVFVVLSYEGAQNPILIIKAPTLRA